MEKVYLKLPSNKFFHIARTLVEWESQVKTTMLYSELVNLEEVEKIRKDYEKKGKLKPTYTAFVVKAVAKAIEEQPNVNRKVFSSLIPFFKPYLVQFKKIDIALAASREGPEFGDHVTFVDIIREANKKNIDEISMWSKSLSSDSNSTGIKQWNDFQKIIKNYPTWLSTFLVYLPSIIPRLWVKYRGSSVLVTSPGKWGVMNWTASFLNTTLGITFGNVKKYPMVYKNKVVARTGFYLNFNCDRRVMAGAPGSRFFKRVIELLENPKELI